MKKLSKTFKSLSAVDRFKMVIVLPILCSIVLFSELIDLTVFVSKRLFYFLVTTWQECIVVSLTVTVFTLMFALLS